MPGGINGVELAREAIGFLALIITEFPRPDERVKAMSAYMFTATAGGSLGLILGGPVLGGLEPRLEVRHEPRISRCRRLPCQRSRGTRGACACRQCGGAQQQLAAIEHRNGLPGSMRPSPRCPN